MHHHQLAFDYCQHDSTDENAAKAMCQECKGSVKVTFDINKEACSVFVPGEKEEDEDKKFIELSEGHRMLHRLLMRTEPEEVNIPEEYGPSSMKNIGERVKCSDAVP